MTVIRGLLINGQDVPAASGRTTTDLDPWSGKPYAQVAAAGAADVTRAVDAAATAFEGWSSTPPSQRRQVLQRAAELLLARCGQAAELMAGEVGGAAPWAGFNAKLASDMLLEAAAATTQPTGRVLATDIPGALSTEVRVPVGVVAAIAPWNAPLILGVRALALPLAVGNTVVLKPSEDAPLACGLFLADLLHEAGLPAGALNVVTNDPSDAAEVVEALIADPRVRMVNFTGSTGVGRRIGVLAAQHLKPAVLELGGKNALIVLADADVDYAVDAAAFGSFMNAGQICMCVDRVIVHRDLAEEFTAKFAAKVAALACGDPADPATVIGPLVNPEAAQRVRALVRDAVERGAQLLTGSAEIGGEAATLLAPMVLAEVPAEARIHHEEIFGPAVVIHVVDSVDAAVDLANDTTQGLSGGVITENLAEGLDVARRVRTGLMHVNDQTVADEPMAPFGGVKDSGYGRFGGRAGAEAFTEVRWITIQSQGHAHYPF